MTKEESKWKMETSQTSLNQGSQQLSQANQQAQNLIGQIQAYNQMLAEEEKPVVKKNTKPELKES